MEENRIKRPSAAAAIILLFVFIAICVVTTYRMFYFGFSLDELFINTSGIYIPGLIVGVIAAVSLIRKKPQGALVSIAVLFFVNFALGLLRAYYHISIYLIAELILLFVLGAIIALVKSNKIQSIVPVIVIGILFLIVGPIVDNILLFAIYYLPLLLAVIIACKYHINCTSLKQTVAESTAYQKSAINNQSKTLNIEVAEKIKKYKELLDMGIINREEFEAKKKELLNL